MRAAFYTLGCKVNQYETNTMRQEFIRDGFTIVEASDYADVYVLNSCTVTVGADRKTRQLLRRFRRKNAAAVVALCGCFPQAFPEEAELLREADVLIGASNKKELLSAVKDRLAGGKRTIHIQPHQKEQPFEEMKVTSFGEKTRAFVKIQDGCERFCSYCIIPFARGSVRSKSLDDLREELTDLVAEGYREVVLVGINLSSYGTESGHRLMEAIQLACKIPGLRRVRLGSLEPELLSSEDISEMAELDTFCPQFHLALQSGSDRVLERMCRPYTLGEYRRIVSDLRAAFQNCAITTDIMVGFPGETEEEHQESLAFVKEIGLARAHVFAYSSRPGTEAALLPEQITANVKARRSKDMIEATNITQQVFLEKQLGKYEEILFDTKIEKGWEGYSKNYTSVRVPSEENLGGKILRVEIIATEKDYCIGRLVE